MILTNFTQTYSFDVLISPLLIGHMATAMLALCKQSDFVDDFTM